ncbi:MAG: tetratricopeptide repeat protein [Pirellulaceae bacterium]|nr:tetratricopeptide repeat protein [Pirellulaceae bacterium]
MNEAIGLAQQGEVVEAVSMMKQCVAEVRENCGDVSDKHAQALFHFGTLLCSTGDLDQGAELCRQAADACPDSTSGKKERLTYLMNVGQMLSHAGKPEQAVPVLQDSLAERIAFYGSGHAGVAYGQQVLAESLLASGQYAQGLEHAQAAVEIFESEQHHEFPGTFALQAALASAAGHTTESIWQGLADYPEDIVVEVIQHSSTTASLMADRLGLVYMEQLCEWCEKYMPEQTALLVNTVVSWSNLAFERVDLESLTKSADILTSLIDKLPDPADRIQLMQGTALSYSRCERSDDDIRRIYERAASEATENSLPLEAANVARNHAIFEAEHDGVEAALAQYDLAIDCSQQAGAEGAELLGRTLVAKGIFLQHQDRPNEAKPLLEQGHSILPATHPDGACGVLHLVALENGMNCCCNGGEGLERESLSLLAKKFFEESGLGDVLESVGIGEDGGLQVHMSREPTADEMERLQVAHGVFMQQLSTIG